MVVHYYLAGCVRHHLFISLLIQQRLQQRRAEFVKNGTISFWLLMASALPCVTCVSTQATPLFAREQCHGCGVTSSIQSLCTHDCTPTSLLLCFKAVLDRHPLLPARMRLLS